MRDGVGGPKRNGEGLPGEPVGVASRRERPHRQLIVWQKSVELVTFVYHLTGKFPAAERYGLAAQMRRAAVSVPSNIAEGAARKGQREYLQFLYTARASLSELDTQVEITVRLGYAAADAAQLQARIDEVSRMLNAMIRSIGRTTAGGEG